ncbi:hypothetical protein N7517_004350 [Penicillium concentricum]|uniref:Epidermal growth factor receptor-like transmembrane-juxtamembrane segment domain-containing protein n=1 Tax=Penicillium concentricum TaxID=293559 RepID=A0A9W9S7F3_9EURO|nr:uncharacterized protein N7517_004350 [Penicillium concentricum]KAJ5372344.1 hypothetical protein N7517_004350 [Penicillium concentricum]
MESLESLGSLVPRDLNACTGTKQWYVCTAGIFHGCCSSDPCTTGICPDDSDNDDSSTTPTKLSTLSLTTAGPIARLPSVTPRTTTTSSMSSFSEPTTVLSTDPSTMAPEPSPTASSITSGTSTGAGIIASSSVLAASASPSSTSPTTPNATSSNLGAIIGGAVGGVAVLVICAILLFCCCRRKRKYGKREKGTSLVSWYSYRFTRKDRATASEMKGPLSPPDSEANIDSFSAVSPFTMDNTRASPILTPDLTLVSSSTSLISHSPHKTPPVPPTKAHSNELVASVPPRQGFTPELQDTGFHRLRAELASHSQSELINVPMEQRQRQQNHIRSRSGPRAWESPALAPIASPHTIPRRGTDNGSGHSHSNSNGGSPARNQAGRVITAEGVVLGANLDRYSNGMEIGESQAQGERGRKAERGETDHVMSFMQYGGRPEDRGLGNGLGISTGGDHASNPQGRGGSASRSRPRPAEHSLEDDIAAAEGNADVPPAYEAEEGAPGHDIKSPSGTMGMSLRGV